MDGDYGKRKQGHEGDNGFAGGNQGKGHKVDSEYGKEKVEDEGSGKEKVEDDENGKEKKSEDEGSGMDKPEGYGEGDEMDEEAGSGQQATKEGTNYGFRSVGQCFNTKTRTFCKTSKSFQQKSPGKSPPDSQTFFTNCITTDGNTFDNKHSTNARYLQ